MDETNILLHHYHVAKSSILLLFHCLLLITYSCMAANTNIKTDESALIALKSSLSYYDSQNVISTNWSNSTPMCSWIGITCSSRHKRVRALSIPDMNLQGNIPPELGNLSFLVSIEMSNNSLNGSLPQEFAKLRRLRSISLSVNNLTGPIPSFFSSLPNLRFLSLWSNQFSGPIPVGIGNVSKLEGLDLSDNFLEGNIPSEIGNLRYLSYLMLESNRLSGPVPLPIFNLSALRSLGLTENKLIGRLPESICDGLPSLQELFLSANRFDGKIPSGLHKCDKLQSLSLAVNHFVGSIPREIGNLTSIRRLYIGHNNLEGQIPKEMGNLQKVDELQLSRNRLNGSIPASIFNISALRVFGCVGNNLLGSLPASLGKGLSNLQELYLGINSLSGFIPDSISNASKLTILDLSTNSFTGPIPDSLGNLEFLEILALGENRFISPSSNTELSILISLTNCRHLNFVDLTVNQLGGKLPTSIGNFSDSLQVFRAGVCRIKGNLPQEIGNLSNLAELNLVYNELSGNVPRTIVGLQKIQQLYLQNNTFTGFIPNEICSLKNLGALRLSHNQISGSLPACVENMTFLRYLHLDSNMLSSSIPTGIWKLNDIIEFNASSNMLYGNLPLEIENLKVATLVDLSMNNLSGNIPTTVGGLQNLIRFSLAQNRLEEHIPDSFGGILSLEYLDISNNNLSGKIPQSLEKLSHLTYFNVSFNNLDGEIPNGGPFVNFTEQSFMHNRALCGASRFHVSPCRPSSRKKPRKNRALHIALYTILAFGAITIALVGLVVLRWRKRRKNAIGQTPALPPQVSHDRISFDELEVATEGFSESNLLGIGGFGSVYKGTLKDGVQVAVKVFNTQLEGAFRSFDTECEVLRSLRHRNLTKVISSCTNLDTRVLVLEYMPNGSLEKWLYSHNYFLDILQRLNIMIDVVCALDYLHNGNLVAVVHCDLKPSNILLDDELVGHVTDFGISKILEAGNSIVRTKTLATIGYIAPEYGLEGVVSTKTDIYSYGILLIETFTRTKPRDDMFARSELSLRQWVKNSRLPSDITRIVDSNLLKEGKESLDAKIECLLSIMDLALKCTEEVPALRITVKDVVTTLNKIKIQLLSSC